MLVLLEGGAFQVCEIWDVHCGVFFLRTSMNGCPVLVSASPGKNTPLCPCTQIPLTASRTLLLKKFELKVLASVSSLYRVILVVSNWLSTTVSAQRATYCPISHISSHRVILRKILWYLHAPGVICRITPMNTMGRSALQSRSLTPGNSSAR